MDCFLRQLSGDQDDKSPVTGDGYAGICGSPGLKCPGLPDRPGRNSHHALDALAAGVVRKNVNWVLDADIRDFFTKLDQGWLGKFLEHRIADQRVLRLIRKWLNAGVIENGEWSRTEEGTPQGASASPLLANVYLHYVFDLWAHWWRRRNAHGDVIIVRWADDFIVGFEHQEDALRFLADLRERFAKFGLELHPDKTRLIEFGRHAARRRRARGLGRPETFDFLGFTHLCGTSKKGRFWLRRITITKRMRTKLREVNDQLKRRRHQPIPEQGQWLASVVRGHRAYYAVPGNTDAVAAFRTQPTRHWYKALRRRSQRTRLNWERMNRLANRWLPPARVMHPFPEMRLTSVPKAGAQRGSPARWDLCGGPPARAVPTATVLRVQRSSRAGHDLLERTAVLLPTAQRLSSSRHDAHAASHAVTPS
jgi:group II intron reverse transcriptase/maturase